MPGAPKILPNQNKPDYQDNGLPSFDILNKKPVEFKPDKIAVGPLIKKSLNGLC
jgi:hypothetical protein